MCASPYTSYMCWYKKIDNKSILRQIKVTHTVPETK